MATSSTALASVGATLAGLLARRLLAAAWRRGTGEEPPRNPAAAGVGWGEALGWAVTAGLAVGVARVVARRGVTATR